MPVAPEFAATFPAAVGPLLHGPLQQRQRIRRSGIALGYMPSRRRRYLLGQNGDSSSLSSITVAQVVAAVTTVGGISLPGYGLPIVYAQSGDDMKTGNVPQECTDAINNSEIGEWIVSDNQCGSQKSSNATFVALGEGKVGLSIAGSIVGGAVGTALSIATAGLGAALAIFGAIWSYHQQQIAKERDIECSAYPAANESIAAIEQGVQSGTLTPAQGITALNTLWSDWNAQVIPPAQQQGVYKRGGGHCDALCVATFQLGALITWLSIQFAIQEASQPAAAATAESAVATVAASTGLPEWAVWAAGFWLLWELL